MAVVEKPFGPDEHAQDSVSALVAALLAEPVVCGCASCRQHLSVAVGRVIEHVRARTQAQLDADANVGSATDSEAGLTMREREVLLHLTAGLSAQQIAKRLQISAATVRKHLEHVYAKLGVHDRLTATIRAQELGLLPQS